MGSRNKLKRFKENETLSNVIQPTREEVTGGFSFKGEWDSFFNNNYPIVLELGCGTETIFISCRCKGGNY